MDGLKVSSKIKFRELNLSGTNNVKSLNELEDRLLKTSISSLEKARKRSLSRLDSEVKGLHHTLRDQNTVRPVSSRLANKVYADSSDVSAVKQATASPLPRKGNERPSSCAQSGDETSEDSEEDEEIMDLFKYDHGIHKGQNQTSTDEFTSRLPPQRMLRRQRSTPDITTSAVVVPSQHRRKISSGDSVAAKGDICSATRPSLHRPLSCNAMELSILQSRSPSNLSINGSQSIRERKISAVCHSAYVRRVRCKSTGSSTMTFQERCALVDRQPDSTLDIPRRRYSHTKQDTFASKKQISRKISCPQPIPGIKQERYDLNINRKDHDEGTRPRSTSELPRLDEPSSGLSFRNLSLSPVGRHIDGLDHMLQARVNNFLMSLETFRNDNTDSSLVADAKF